MNNSNSSNTGNDGKSVPGLMEILASQSTLAPGPDVTRHASSTVLPQATAKSEDGDDNAWVIAVAVVVPLIIIIIVVLIIGYIIYRRKYPVRMILGREFSKVRNPNYDRPLSSATLVREDAEIYFSTRTGELSGISDLNEYNPVNTGMFDNHGYQRDADEDGDDEEDSDDEAFRLKKKWLFKNYSEEEKNTDDTYEAVVVNRKTESRNGEGNKSESETSDIEAMLSGPQTTPIPKRKIKKNSSCSSSDEDKHSSGSNVSHTSLSKAHRNSQEDVKLQKGLETPSQMSHLDEGFNDPRSTRSQSLTINSPTVDARPRSFSVDLLKSARKYSLRKELSMNSVQIQDFPDFAANSVSANIVDVIIATGGSQDSLGSFLKHKQSFTSFNSMNSNPHLVTDLDESDNATDDSRPKVDKDHRIPIDIKHRDEDLEQLDMEYEDVEAALAHDQVNLRDEFLKLEPASDSPALAREEIPNIDKTEDTNKILCDSNPDTDFDVNSRLSKESNDSKPENQRDFIKIEDSIAESKNSSAAFLTSSSVTGGRNEIQDIDKSVGVLARHPADTHDFISNDITSSEYENISFFETQKNPSDLKGHPMLYQEATCKALTHQNVAERDFDSQRTTHISLDEACGSPVGNKIENDLNEISEVDNSILEQDLYENVSIEGDLYQNATLSKVERVNADLSENLDQALGTDHYDDHDKSYDDDSSNDHDDGHASSGDESQSSTSQSSSDEHYEEYLIADEDFLATGNRHTVSKGKNDGHMERPQTVTVKTAAFSSDQNEITRSDYASHDLKMYAIDHPETSQREDSIELGDLVYENTHDMVTTKAPEQCELKEMPQVKRENEGLLKEQNDLVISKEAETKHYSSDDSDDDDKLSSVSSHLSSKGLSDSSSDLEEPRGHDPKGRLDDSSVPNSQDNEKSLRQTDELEGFRPNGQQRDFMHASPPTQTDGVVGKTPEGRIKIKMIPALQLSASSSDSDDAESDARPPINMESHPQLRSQSFDEQGPNIPEIHYTVDDINEVSSSDESTLRFAKSDSTNHNSEKEDDVSFSFQILNSFNSLDNDEDDDIDV